jgi:hypothetical protein
MSYSWVIILTLPVSVAAVSPIGSVTHMVAHLPILMLPVAVVVSPVCLVVAQLPILMLPVSVTVSSISSGVVSSSAPFV